MDLGILYQYWFSITIVIIWEGLPTVCAFLKSCMEEEDIICFQEKYRSNDTLLSEVRDGWNPGARICAYQMYILVER